MNAHPMFRRLGMCRHLLAFGFLLALETAQACSCFVPARKLDEAATFFVSQSDEIVRARVIDALEEDDGGSTYRVRVLETLRSPTAVGAEIVLKSRHSAACGMRLGQSEEWLLFLSDRSLRACRGNTRLEATDAQQALPDGEKSQGNALLERVRETLKRP